MAYRGEKNTQPGNAQNGQSAWHPKWLMKPPAPTPPFSSNSTASIPNSLWYASDFILGAGIVIIQPETSKIVVIYDDNRKGWFLPKGRKDIGESLEHAALREAYEESGYRVEFLPLYTPTRAPAAPNTSHDKARMRNTEAIYVTTQYWPPNPARQGQPADDGGEYLVFYYVGRLALGAEHKEGTGMSDEQGYRSHLLSPDEALVRLKGSVEEPVVRKAWALWVDGLQYEELLKKEAPETADLLEVSRLSSL